MTKHTQKCLSCHEEITGELYHMGFSNIDAIYCTSCPNVLLIKDRNFYDKNNIEFPHLVAGDKGWQEYNRHLLPYYKNAEQHLPQCSCGDSFEYMAPPRCPKCNGYIFGKSYENKPVLRNINYAFVTKKSKSI